MNKTDLIHRAAQMSGATKKDTEAVAEALFDAMCQALASGEKITLTNFGTFEVRRRVARVGRNPKTGDIIQIPSGKTPVFHPCAALKKAVDK